MQFDKSPYYGKQVKFTDKFNREFEGVVVKTVTYSHCAGANSYTIYVSNPESNRVYGVSLGFFKVIGEGDVEAARQDYKAYLMQYPAWQKHFENGVSVGW